MSINYKQSIKCPQCGHLQEMNVWSSITCDDSPDLKQDLLEAKINIFRCEDCGQAALVPAPLLYHDKDKKLLISFTPCNDNTQKLKLFEEVKKASRESEELKEYEDYNLRFVTVYDELLEKLLIFDNGLHDKVIEVLKVLILTQEPEKAEHRSAVFGKTDGENLEFLIKDTKEMQFYTSKIPVSSYETIKEQLRLSGVKYKSFDWEIVDIDYGTGLLRGINNNLA